jgi:hypothetical protein
VALSLAMTDVAAVLKCSGMQTEGSDSRGICKQDVLLQQMGATPQKANPDVAKRAAETDEQTTHGGPGGRPVTPWSSS